MKYFQGSFKPKNATKYKGNPLNICYRSQLELKYMCWLDDDPSILAWSSEEIAIPYLDKTSGRTRRYYPDFWYKTSTKQYLVEIKPSVQCRPPKIKKKQNHTYINEVRTYATNTSKWSAAEKYAQARGMTFILITEKELANL